MASQPPPRPPSNTKPGVPRSGSGGGVGLERLMKGNQRRQAATLGSPSSSSGDYYESMYSTAESVGFNSPIGEDGYMRMAKQSDTYVCSHNPSISVGDDHIYVWSKAAPDDWKPQEDDYAVVGTLAPLPDEGDYVAIETLSTAPSNGAYSTLNGVVAGMAGMTVTNDDTYATLLPSKQAPVCASATGRLVSLPVVQYTNVSPSQMGNILMALQDKRCKIHTLWLAHSHISPSGVKALCDAVRAGSGSLKKLALAACEIDDQGASALAALIMSSNVKELELPSNKITPVGIEELAKAMQRTPLERLKLDGNRISPNNVYHLVEAILKHKNFFRQLSLSLCNFNDRCFDQLYNVLFSHVGLSGEITVQGHQLTDLEVVAQRVKELCRLKHPNLIFMY
eukprot:TRINITY_DN11920_c0_g5_i2.p1 TRINITY_DN11920_c0_g5~~TRINITY_DN11920_c0_g5_i2.p1  ORF type:complete len:395 (+),score=98.27 TRINITY_DN11920_c0_g5_i2:111-1295(+)